MDLNQNFAALTDEELATYAAQVRAAFDAIAASDTPTDAQLDEAEGYADHLEAIGTEQAARVERAETRASRAAALRTRFSTAAPEEPEEDEAEDEDDEDDDAGEPAAAPVEAPPAQPQARGGVTTLARKVTRPAKPARSQAPIAITAAADVPDHATGSVMTMGDVGQAAIKRLRAFGTPSGNGQGQDLRMVGLASFTLDFPSELTIDRHSDDMEVLTRAGDQSRLPGGSLVAAGGWCAPSETLYDLCSGETTDGILSIPEVNVARGGIKYTKGPSFADIYDDTGFCQTEAQAIAGTTKPCYEIECPPFVEVRLDACGICIKVPILTNAAYPELTQRYLSGSMIAHQHKMNAKVLAAIAAGSADITSTGLGAVAVDTVDALTLQADVIRQKYRLSMSAALEVVLPFWAKDVIKLDVARRNAIAIEQVTDAYVSSLFAGFNLSVQYVYDWQPVAAGTAWPDDFHALMYPAGTWVKGTANVINLNAVYDAASLATNTYTGLFFEQGILTAQMCYESVEVVIPVCSAGRSGAADLTCA